MGADNAAAGGSAAASSQSAPGAFERIIAVHSIHYPKRAKAALHAPHSPRPAMQTTNIARQQK